VIDLGGKRVRYLATPHVPHGWEAGLLFEETTSPPDYRHRSDIALAPA
jgi:hypothetical protein